MFGTIRIALRALAKNKMRASLTVLGVVIGIAAVTAMVSIGQSAGQMVQGEFQSLGTNVLIVFPDNGRGRGVRRTGIARLTAGDAEAIGTECPSVLAASPSIWTGGQVIYGNVNWNPNEMLGVGVDYLRVRNWPLRRGSFFTEADIRSAAKNCVIGQTLVVKLFQTSNPIGQTIRVRNIPLRVIGVLESKGANLVGQDQDNILLMPFTTVRKRLQRSSFDSVGTVFVSARDGDNMQQTVFEIAQLLYQRHRIPLGEEPDFQIQNMTEIADVFGTVMGTMTFTLVIIAGISLVVGGVGVMNIMLVSVTERTREIGIRMAVGARGRDIMWQFLVESVVLSWLGGMAGFLLGAAASVGLTKAINSLSSGADWPVVISIPAAILAIVVSAVVGISFGFYPAWRASRLDPIEALRYE